jgi:hypothetical protein
VAARSVTSSYGDTKSTEQLAKSNGSNASKENARRAMQTELRVRVGGELMVNRIEIAKPLTRLKSTRPNPVQRFAGVLLQEHWIEYRATAESLRKEKFLFLTQTEPYDKDDAFPVLVQRVKTPVPIKGRTCLTKSTPGFSFGRFRLSLGSVGMSEDRRRNKYSTATRSTEAGRLILAFSPYSVELFT